MKWKLDGVSADALPACESGLPLGTENGVFVDRPTVRVARMTLPNHREVVVKRYFFPSLAKRLGGALRHTGFGTPKAVREAENLVRLRAASLPVVEPLAWAVARTPFGLVADSWLMTTWEGGTETLERLLLAGRAPELEFWSSLGKSVRAIHNAGCWYRNLCVRNLLVKSDGSGFLWLDPGKSKWQNGPIHETHALTDLLVLLGPVEAFLPDSAWEEFMEGYERWRGVRNAKDLFTLLPSIAHSTMQGLLLREKRRLSTSA